MLPTGGSSLQTMLGCQKKLEDTVPQRQFVKSVDHPDFKRLQALENSGRHWINWIASTKSQQFLVQGGVGKVYKPSPAVAGICNGW